MGNREAEERKADELWEKRLSLARSGKLALLEPCPGGCEHGAARSCTLPDGRHYCGREPCHTKLKGYGR